MNVGLLVYSSPIVTAGFIYLFDKSEKVGITYVIGFFLAISGIALIIFNGAFVFDLNPLGDALALVACVLWGLCCVFIKRTTAKGYNILYSTRKILFYGLITAIPLTLFMDFRFDLYPLRNATGHLGVLLIGIVGYAIGGYAIAYITWSKATKELGATKAATFLYLTPVVTMIVSFFVLRERITIAIIVGAFLVLTGLYVSGKNSLAEVKNMFAQDKAMK